MAVSTVTATQTSGTTQPAPGASPAASAAPAQPTPTPAPTPAEMYSPAPTPAPTPEATPTPGPSYSIEIDLAKQRAYLFEDGEQYAAAPISSGRAGHLTPTGDFSVIQKDLNHVSNLYGMFVEKESGRVVKQGADSAMPVPKGCKFVPAPMKWFLRLDGADGMHAGYLPGYPASHGCVRMPAAKAQLFYETVPLGTPVHVFGTTPLREESPESRPEAAATSKPAPAPTPVRGRGWFFFEGPHGMAARRSQ